MGEKTPPEGELDLSVDRWEREQPQQYATVTATVVRWFRDAHDKLKNLPIKEVRRFAYSLRSIVDPERPGTHRAFEERARAFENSVRAADTLRKALVEYRTWDEVLTGRPSETWAEVATALNKGFKGHRYRSKPGRPDEHWVESLRLHGPDIEWILRRNGHPRTSLGSNAGPAPIVMAELIYAERQLRLEPGTIARKWQEQRKAERECDDFLPGLGLDEDTAYGETN